MRARTPTGSATGSRPKTRTEPVSACNRPSTCLISVVLPAPLAPTRPNTAPRGTARLTRSSATLAPKRRVTPRMSMTGSGCRGSLAGMESLLCGLGLHGRVALAQYFDDLFGADVHLARFGQEGVDTFGQDLQALAPGEGGSGVRHVSARGAAFGDDAGRLQLA